MPGVMSEECGSEVHMDERGVWQACRGGRKTWGGSVPGVVSEEGDQLSGKRKTWGVSMPGVVSEECGREVSMDERGVWLGGCRG